MENTSHSRILTGWGKTNPAVCKVASLDRSSLADVLAECGHRGVTVRGLGRSYGDAAQNGGGQVLICADRINDVHLDVERAIVRSPAGVSLDDMIRYLVPRGFFIPVTPGTRFVTVGGAVASDIHGKNHHIDGSFGDHVESMSLLLADGSIRDVSAETDTELFWATIGGMGLTGAILDVTFRVLRIETSRCTVSIHRCPDLDSLMDKMSTGDEDVRYSVAWSDLLARGSRLGRSVLWRGDHTLRSELSDSDGDPLAYSTKNMGSIPAIVPPPGLVNRATTTVFNEVWFRKAPRSRTGEIKSIPSFFHPLDAVGNWNRLYGPRGFLQYQFVVPFGAEDALRNIVVDIAQSGVASPLVVLKRFGAGNRGMLSFPISGWTLTVDIPSRAEGLPTLLRSLDERVLQAGGRHYLAKDAHMRPETLRLGYPRLEEFLAVKSRVDPNNVWTSDLARRLQLLN